MVAAEPKFVPSMASGVAETADAGAAQCLPEAMDRPRLIASDPRTPKERMPDAQTIDAIQTLLYMGQDAATASASYNWSWAPGDFVGRRIESMGELGNLSTGHASYRENGQCSFLLTHPRAVPTVR